MKVNLKHCPTVTSLIALPVLKIELNTQWSLNRKKLKICPSFHLGVKFLNCAWQILSLCLFLTFQEHSDDKRIHVFTKGKGEGTREQYLYNDFSVHWKKKKVSNKMTEVIHKINNFHYTYLISEACKKCLMDMGGRRKERKERGRKGGRKAGSFPKFWHISN